MHKPLGSVAALGLEQLIALYFWSRFCLGEEDERSSHYSHGVLRWIDRLQAHVKREIQLDAIVVFPFAAQGREAAGQGRRNFFAAHGYACVRTSPCRNPEAHGKICWV